MARSQSDSINAYLDNLNPLAGYTFGQYAHDVGQFGLGEGKAFGNAIVGGVVDTGKLALYASGPAGALVAEQVPPGWSSPFAASGNPMQQSGYVTGTGIALVGSIAAIAVGDPEGVEALAGAESKLATGPNCFIAGTLVQMADGTTKPIEQVRTGDLVKSRNPQSGKIEAKRVDRTYVRVAPQVLTLTFTDAHTGQTETLTCTPEHPFYVDGQGYVKAGDLGIGTSIVTRAGPSLTLSTVAWNAPVGQASGSGLLLDGQAHPTGITVYNLRVEDTHNYFVGTQHGGTCVHNADYDILFGQARADANFSTKAGVPAHLKGRSIDSVVGELKSGKLSSDDIQIEAFQHEDGQLVSTNTRGLAALSKAGLKPTKVIIRTATRSEKLRLKELSALGHKLPSRSIAITPSRADRTIIETIHVPN